jgi:hypothetical protein
MTTLKVVGSDRIFDDLDALRVVPSHIPDLALHMRDTSRAIPGSEVRVTEALRSVAPRWCNAREIATAADIRPSQARSILQALVVLGFADQVSVHGAPRYRLGRDMPIDAIRYADRVLAAKLALTHAVSHPEQPVS